MHQERSLSLILVVAVFSSVITPGRGAGTALDALKAIPEISDFTELVTALPYASQLSNATWVGTIFAPTNDALNKNFQGPNKPTIAQLKADPTFQMIVAYHIIPRENLTKAQLVDGLNLASAMPTEAVAVSVTAVNGTQLKSGTGSATIVKPDLPAGYGYIQEIDNMLVPFSVAVRAQAAAQQAQGGSAAGAPGAPAAAQAQPKPQQQPAQLIQPNLRRMLL